MAETPRILVAPKDFPTLASGYGIIGKHLLPRLAARYGKENIILFAPVFNQAGMVKQWEGIKTLSGLKGDYGEDRMWEHYRREKCTMLLTIGDVFQFRVLPKAAQENPDFSWVAWAPMDYLYIPPAIMSVTHYAMYIVPFSLDSERRFIQAEANNTLPHIPLAVDPSIWRPRAPAEYAEAAKLAGFQDGALNLLIVQANQQRKYVRQQLEAIRLFRQLHPEVRVRLYYHTHIEGDRNALDDVEDTMLQDVTRMVDPYVLEQGGMPEEELALFFNAASIVLACAQEGWGLSITQAQASGRSAIVLVDGAGPEQLSFGVVVSPSAIDYYQRATKAVAQPVEICTAIEQIWREGVYFNQAAADQTHQRYNWDRVAEMWFRVVDKVHEDRERLSLYIPEPSGVLKQRAQNLKLLKP